MFDFPQKHHAKLNVHLTLHDVYSNNSNNNEQSTKYGIFPRQNLQSTIKPQGFSVLHLKIFIVTCYGKITCLAAQ